MNYKWNYLLIVTIFFVFTINAYGQNWLWQIKPLQTNISEVKKMLTVKPKLYGNDQLEFILDEGKLTIGFSPYKCVETSWGKWNVEEDTVIDIVYYPDKERKPSFYNLKKAGMRQGFDQGHTTYSSDVLGIYYSVEFGKVSGIHVYPASKYETLKCGEKN